PCRLRRKEGHQKIPPRVHVAASGPSIRESIQEPGQPLKKTRMAPFPVDGDNKLNTQRKSGLILSPLSPWETSCLFRTAAVRSARGIGCAAGARITRSATAGGPVLGQRGATGFSATAAGTGGAGAARGVR